MINITGIYKNKDFFKYVAMNLKDKDVIRLRNEKDSFDLIKGNLIYALEDCLPSADGKYKNREEHIKDVKEHYRSLEDEWKKPPEWESSLNKDDVIFVLNNNKGDITLSDYKDLFKVYKKFTNEN